MTIKGGSSHACAACKYQRRKCSSECLLAAFFPSDNPKIFHNAHRLFGVRNIVKILKNLDQYQKEEAMKSITYQSNMREEFPVHGCCAVIARLEYQIHHAQEELHAVLSQLAIYSQNQQQQEISCTQNHSLSELQIGMVNPGPSDLPLSNLPTETGHIYPNASFLDFGSDYKDHMVNSYCVQNPDPNGNDNSNGDNVLKLMQNQMINTNEIPLQKHEAPEYGEIHSFFDTIDDRQSFIVSKEANDSSSDSSLKDTASPIEFVADDELKNAAACFSLTSVNGSHIIEA